MRNTFVTIGIIIVSVVLLNSCKTSVIFSTSEPDAQIFVDGRPMGSGPTEVVKISKNNCVRVKVVKPGFLTKQLAYCYTGVSFEAKTKYIQLVNDDAYDASIKNDYANKDFEQEVGKDLTEDAAWKVISQIVTGYFDNLEMADRATGYMKTSWQSKSFTQKTIRTRVIIKQSSSKPLKYKIKIISEYADSPNQSVKNDDRFKEWDRILRAYNGMINEFQSRLR
ncbi:MAG: hypothetical protein PHW82_09265 [Bacteroidales bacterium]|nr:hypothetical protein [Bacteroidales bacterium]